VIDTVDLTAGIRYQDEKRKLKGSRTSFLLEDDTEVVLPLPQGAKDPLHAKQTSARVALQWRPFGPDDQIYASWARAYKNPTYNTVNVTGNLFGTMVPLKEEKVDTYELGVKTELFDGNLQLNAATFYTLQKDPLSANVSIPSGGIANFTNAGEAEIKGADGDFLLIPLAAWNPGLVITGGVSYLDAIYTDFKNGRGYDDLTGLGFGNGGASLPVRDLSGNRIPRVPKWSYQLGFNQRISLDNGNAIEIGADTFYTSKIYFLPQNSELSVREPTTLYNARVSYFYNPWGMELTAFINNITDEIYADSAFVTDFGSAYLVNEDPRLYGLRVRVTF
jgi:iron complex outermembrane receptor protein